MELRSQLVQGTRDCTCTCLQTTLFPLQSADLPCPQLPDPGPTTALRPPQRDCLQAPPESHSSPCLEIGHIPQQVPRSRLHSWFEVLLTPSDHTRSLSQDSTLASPPPHPRLHSLRVPFGTQAQPLTLLQTSLAPHPGLAQTTPTTHLPCRCR